LKEDAMVGEGRAIGTKEGGVQSLRGAAGLSSDCTIASCDVDDNGAVTVSDRVRLLRAAAGLPVDLECP
jgi:hypothetical protein